MLMLDISNVVSPNGTSICGSSFDGTLGLAEGGVPGTAEAYGVPGTIWVEQFRRLEQYLDP